MDTQGDEINTNKNKHKYNKFKCIYTVDTHTLLYDNYGYKKTTQHIKYIERSLLTKRPRDKIHIKKRDIP